MLKAVTILSMILLSLQVFGQTSGKTHKEFLKKLKKADELFEYHDFVNGLYQYQELLKIDSLHGEINYKIGVCIYNLNKNRMNSLPYFIKGANENVIESHFYLGKLYHLRMEFELALNHYHQYKAFKGIKNFNYYEVESAINTTRNAMELVKKPKNVIVENMGEQINSPYPDYVPLLSADENVMIFTSRREGSTGSQKDPYGDYFEDIYVSVKGENGWGSPVSISDKINTPTHDACAALSPHGEKLIIYRTNEKLTGGDLYITNYDGFDWSEPEKLSSNINAENSWQPSASLSADNKLLYFSSNRPGGYGGKDIYRSVKLPNGDWSQPYNLGPVINTPYDDDAPFIHPDGKTLYFSSKGHNSIGGYDIFKTEVNKNGTWSFPENMGYPINTVADDIYFIISMETNTGYYSSNRASGFGGTDIYKIIFPETHIEYTVIKGTLETEDSNNNLLQAKITLIDEEKKEVCGLYKANRNTGKFIIIITPGIEYKVIIEAEGYAPFTGQINSKTENFSPKLIKKSE
jgi:hypothetical protein